MDKNKIITILLLSTIFLTYMHFFGPSKPIQQNNIPTPSTGNNQENINKPNIEYGIFQKHTIGVEEEIKLENSIMTIILSSKGASIKKVILNKYKTYQKTDLALVDHGNSKMGLLIPYKDQLINTHNLFFNVIENKKNKEVTFKLKTEDNKEIIKKFTLNDNYTLDCTVKTNDLNDHLLSNKQISFFWDQDIKLLEKSSKDSEKKTTINYYLHDNNKFNSLKAHSEKKESKDISSPLKWIAIKQKFFSSAVIAKNKFSDGQISIEPSNQEGIIKHSNIKLNISNDDLINGGYELAFYFGPNEYSTLKAITTGFSNNVYLGWPAIKMINQVLTIPTFKFLEKYIPSYGVIIVILVILMKLILVPFSYQSQIGNLKIKAITPMLESIKEKYKSDNQKMQLEQARIYKEMGINPLTGCLPLLLQSPILIAMFNFFPNAIELRQKSFLWVDDLSTYDSIFTLPFNIPIYGNHVSLFTILMTISTILYTKSTSNNNASIQGPMKQIGYIMPITFMFILNSLPAALSFYYFISNIISFIQQYIINIFVNEEKIKANMDIENKLVNSTKTRAQNRIEKKMDSK